MLPLMLLPFTVAFLALGLEVIHEEQFPPPGSSSSSSHRGHSHHRMSTVAHGPGARRIGAAFVALSFALGVWIVRLLFRRWWRTLWWRRSATLLALAAILTSITAGFGPWFYGWTILPSLVFCLPILILLYGGLVHLEIADHRGAWVAWAAIAVVAAMAWTIFRHGETAFFGWLYGFLFTGIVFGHLWLFWRETQERRETSRRA